MDESGGVEYTPAKGSPELGGTGRWSRKEESVDGGSVMTSVCVAKRISPMLATSSMEETILFYQSVLGFTPTMKSPEYSILERDGQTVHFQKAASGEVMRCVRGHTEIYVEVSGIHALWEHVKTFRNRYKIRDLFDREYGMTEFHVEDPNGCLVFVGEPSTKPN
jgi:catechol 2,3-dioxygenase-like lactoylglutathione lyase family enzyme